MKKVAKIMVTFVMVMTAMLSMSSTSVSAKTDSVPDAGGYVTCKVENIHFLGSTINCGIPVGSSYYYGTIPYIGILANGKHYWRGDIPYVGESYRAS